MRQHAWFLYCVLGWLLTVLFGCSASAPLSLYRSISIGDNLQQFLFERQCRADALGANVFTETTPITDSRGRGHDSVTLVADGDGTLIVKHIFSEREGITVWGAYQHRNWDEWTLPFSVNKLRPTSDQADSEAADATFLRAKDLLARFRRIDLSGTLDTDSLHKQVQDSTGTALENMRTILAIIALTECRYYENELRIDTTSEEAYALLRAKEFFSERQEAHKYKCEIIHERFPAFHRTVYTIDLLPSNRLQLRVENSASIPIVLWTVLGWRAALGSASKCL